MLTQELKPREGEVWCGVNLAHIAHPLFFSSRNPLPNPSTMPRVIQPSGGGGKIRVRYTPHRKHGLIAASKRLVAEGMSLRNAAADLRGSATNLSKWVMQGAKSISWTRSSSPGRRQR